MSATPPPFGGGVFIADKSAWERARHPTIRDAWAEAVRNDQIVTCDLVDLELLYSTRDAAEFQSREGNLNQLRHVPIGPAEFRAAITALRGLAQIQPIYHRVSLPDALIAAAAQAEGIGVLHYDKHFDRLSEVMVFESRWIAPAGSVP